MQLEIFQKNQQKKFKKTDENRNISEKITEHIKKYR